MRIRLHDPITVVTTVLLCMLIAALVTVSLGGCAKNQLIVEETTPDGCGTFKMQQTTSTTWGAKTDKGHGGVDYKAEGGDGSSFSLVAGAKVEGQSAADPSVGITQILGAMGALATGLQQPPAPAESPLPVGVQLPTPLSPEWNVLMRSIMDSIRAAAEVNGYDLPKRYGIEPPKRD